MSRKTLASLLVVVLSALLTLSLLLVPNKQAPVLAVIVGLVVILGCLWILTGRQNRGGLMSPNTLRVLSFLLLILPIVGLLPAIIGR